MEPHKIIVVVEGGKVQSVLTEGAALCAVVDYDAEGADAKEICHIPQGDGRSADALVELNYTDSRKPDHCQAIWKAVQEHVFHPGGGDE